MRYSVQHVLLKATTLTFLSWHVTGCNTLLGDLTNAPDGGVDGRSDAPAVMTSDGSADHAVAADAGRDSGHDAKLETGSDAQPAGCEIDGVLYLSGSANGSDACQSCQPSMSVSAWTSVADGANCGAGGICHAGACVSGCEIAGVYYSASTANPSNPCQTCQPATGMNTSWTNASEGTSCGADICHAGACVSGCEIAGAYEAANQLNPSDPCQSCQPTTSGSVWSPVADGISCGNGQVCGGGNCGTQCDIGDAGIVTSGALNPSNPCQSCQPGTNALQWTSIATGSACGGAGSGKVCSGATCTPGCFIANTFYAPNATGSLGCQVCQPGTSTTSWTSTLLGTPCGTSGEVCNGGSCVGGCVIAGTYYAPSVSNPSDICQSCQPTTSTDGWTASSGGTCAAGEVCSAGSCVAGCYLGGAFYTAGETNPANACQVCDAATNSWGSVADESPCASGSCCSGACVDEQTSEGNCGGCGMGCTAPTGTTVSCSAASCTPTCLPNYCPTDGSDATNGCYPGDGSHDGVCANPGAVPEQIGCTACGWNGSCNAPCINSTCGGALTCPH